jgi:hypothetical protein
MQPPKIKVLGLYSPAANAVEYEAFLDKEVASRNPINFSERTKAFLRRVGREDEIVDLPTESLQEIRQDLGRDLSNAVLVEVLVEEPDDGFDVGDFIQPNPARPPGSWQVAWCEKYLTPDGTSLLGDYGYNEVPTEPPLRIAFYIHDWKPENGLNGPYGALALPPMEPMPIRLWRLVPYEQVDAVNGGQEPRLFGGEDAVLESPVFQAMVS